MLSSLLLPILRARFAGRGLVESASPDPCAFFPGTHPGIRGLSVYDDEHELTVCVDDLTHGHLAEYDDAVPEAERDRRVVERVVDFLDDVFADRVIVWGQYNIGGGWYRIDSGGSREHSGIPEFVWSGPWVQMSPDPGDPPNRPT
ncbi:hypothetical protein J8F10_02430 [Gemmata sp. G18]|uniref:Uncharacterized protein n=1 Tax=Gemmata palustris TaxID=2822762 RepID=A0ABS5BKC3_9BACT|nr:hypothetical protein [Gemmata palustris]MBP3954154.1 hypothetical protein [Gemmata palustris]